MTWPTLPPIRPRRLKRGAAVTCAVIAGHALLLAALCWTPRTQMVTETGDYGQAVRVSLVTAPSLAEAAPITPPAQPTKPAAPDVQEIEPAPLKLAAARPDPILVSALSPPEPVTPSTEAQPDLSEADAQALAQFQPPAAGTPGEPCNLTAALASAFAQSPEVRQGLDQLPLSDRSVANAVNLWDGQWPNGSVASGRALLRALLVKAVSTARPDCLSQPNRGPVLVFVPEGATTAVLAIGSGEWTWGDLLAEMPDSAPQLAANSYFPLPASVAADRP